jgi:hypothetical protein
MTIEKPTRRSTRFSPTEGIAGSSERRRTVILSLWGGAIYCVIIGSLAPAASPLMVAIGRWEKLQPFGAYLAVSMLPGIGFRDQRRGILAGLSMFVL